MTPIRITVPAPVRYLGLRGLIHDQLYAVIQGSRGALVYIDASVGGVSPAALEWWHRQGFDTT